MKPAVLDEYRRRYTRNAYFAAAALCLAVSLNTHAEPSVFQFLMQVWWGFTLGMRARFWWHVDRRL